MLFGFTSLTLSPQESCGSLLSAEFCREDDRASNSVAQASTRFATSGSHCHSVLYNLGGAHQAHVRLAGSIAC